MNGQNIGLVICHDMKHIGQKARLIIHLNHEGYGLSLRIVMKGKNVIFIFIERTPADSHPVGGLLHRGDTF